MRSSEPETSVCGRNRTPVTPVPHWQGHLRAQALPLCLDLLGAGAGVSSCHERIKDNILGGKQLRRVEVSG